MRKISGPWLSYHLYLPPPLEPFFVVHLLPMLERSLSEGRIKRFFFIRYSDVELHLRLRFRLRCLTGSAVLKKEIAQIARSYLDSIRVDGPPLRLEEQDYDREKLYFGETSMSVYSELLNERTSWLGLKIMKNYGHLPRIQRWIITSAIMDYLYRSITDEEEELIEILACASCFAYETADKTGFSVAGLNEQEERGRDAILIRIRTRVAESLKADPVALHLTALLRRAKRYSHGGRTVVVHALHLLCNKVGLTIHEEYGLAETLHRLILRERDGRMLCEQQQHLGRQESLSGNASQEER